MSVEEINARVAEFETLDFGDKMAVVLWIKEMFELCGAAKLRMPNGEVVASRVEQIYNVTPEEKRSETCPKEITGRYDWLMGLSLKAIRVEFDDFYLYYRTAASIIVVVLEDMPKTV